MKQAKGKGRKRVGEIPPEVLRVLEGQKTLSRAKKKALEEAGLLLEAAEAFRELEADARRAAEGWQPVCDWSPGGCWARLADKAAGFPSPLADLAVAVEAVRDFARWPDRDKDGEPAPVPEDAEAAKKYMLAALEWRVEERRDGRWPDARDLRRAAADELAADCRTFGAVAEARAEGILAEETLRGCWRLELAEVKAKLANVKGDRAGYRQWKRKAKTEREAVRALEVAQLLGTAGWTVEEVADKMGLSVATVERAAKLARERGLLAKRAPGRRMDAMGRLDKGAAASRAIDNATGQAWDD